MSSCFLAYRKANAPLRDRLIDAIRALKNDDFPFELWSDDHLIPGDEWARTIACRIDEADIFFLLVTTEYSPSSYAIETELARAIARAKRNQRIRIVPIIADNIVGFLGQADITEFRYHALPAGGKGLSHYGDTSEWLAAVVAGVKRLILAELAGMQLRSLDLAEEVEHYRSHVISALTLVDKCEGELGRFTSVVRYALTRAYDVLDVGPEAFSAALLPVRQRVNEARRAAREAEVREIEIALRDIGAAIDDLQDASRVPDTPASLEPDSRPAAILAASEPSVARDRLALQARLASVEIASEALEEIGDPVSGANQQFLVTAGRQIGAESRIAQTAIHGPLLEANSVSAAIGQLARTVGTVTRQAPDGLPLTANEVIRDTQNHTDTAVRYADRLYARAYGLAIPDVPEQRFEEEPTPVPDEAQDLEIDETISPFTYITPHEKGVLGTLALLATSDIQYAYEVGTRYELGRGVRKSYALARAFYRYAGRKGYARAWNRLGRMERRVAHF